MKVALLVCDHVLPELEHIDGQYLDMFRNLLPELELIPYYACDGHLPLSAYEYAAYIGTGSKYSVYDEEPWIMRLREFVNEIYTANKTFVGVCFGHQLIAESLDGKVERASPGWNVGVHEFEMIEKAPYIDPFQAKFNALMMCQDQVTRLPSDTIVLARSHLCPVAMYCVGDHFLGIQAHPEFSKEYNTALINSRTEKIGDETVAAAKSNMSLSVNRELIAGWMTNFIRLCAK